VTILQQPYTLLAAGDPRETEDLAASVDRLMTSIAGKSRSVDAARVGVLACLHLADQLRAAERELEALRERTAELAELLKETIETGKD